MTHSADPWQVIEWFGPDGKLVAHAIANRDGVTIASTWAGPQRANAALMAAAPELYQLALAFRAYANSGENFQYPPKSLRQLDDILARIEAQP